MVYLALTAMLMLVLWPLLLPAVIHGSHTIANSRRKSPHFERLIVGKLLANSHAT